MKTALQRELSVTFWQLAGALLALGLLAGLGVFWGQSIEGRIDSVVDDHAHDRRVLRQLVHEARPASGPRSASTGTSPARVEPAAGIAAPEPSSAGVTPGDAAGDEGPKAAGPDEPRHDPPPAAENDSADPAPPSAPAAAPPSISPPPANPEPSPSQTPAEDRSLGDVVREVATGAGSTAGNVLDETGEAVKGLGCEVTSGLQLPNPPC